MISIKKFLVLAFFIASVSLSQRSIACSAEDVEISRKLLLDVETLFDVGTINSLELHAGRFRHIRISYCQSKNNQEFCAAAKENLDTRRQIIKKWQQETYRDNPGTVVFLDDLEFVSMFCK